MCSWFCVHRWLTLTLVVNERNSLFVTGELHDRLSYVWMKTPAGSVTV